MGWSPWPVVHTVMRFLRELGAALFEFPAHVVRRVVPVLRQAVLLEVAPQLRVLDVHGGDQRFHLVVAQHVSARELVAELVDLHAAAAAFHV